MSIFPQMEADHIKSPEKNRPSDASVYLDPCGLESPLMVQTLPIPMPINALLRTINNTSRPISSKELIPDNKTQPNETKNTRYDEIPDIGTFGNLNVIFRQLESETIVDDTQKDSTSTNPTMYISENVFPTRPFEEPMLYHSSDRLDEHNNATNNQPDDNMRRYISLQHLQIMRNPNSQSERHNHQDRCKDLNRDVNRHYPLGEVCVAEEGYAVNGEMNRHGAEWVEYYEDD